jgi:DNA helicase-2/ATP-dependent DNA helicase PcrA
VPSFVVLTDVSLYAFCDRQPRSLAELLQVPGIGRGKAERYGSELFALLEEFEKNRKLTSDAS